MNNNEEMIQAFMNGWGITRDRAIEILTKSGYFYMPGQEYLDQESK